MAIARPHPARRTARTVAAPPVRALPAAWVFAATLTAALGAALVFAAPAQAADAGRVPKPVVAIAKPGQCVADADFMRRNHMELLKHDRDRTVRAGVRKVQASLKACVECHASQRTGAVNVAPDDFCASCHAYAGVSLDCFECHAGSRHATPAHPVPSGATTGVSPPPAAPAATAASPRPAAPAATAASPPPAAPAPTFAAPSPASAGKPAEGRP